MSNEADGRKAFGKWTCEEPDDQADDNILTELPESVLVKLIHIEPNPPPEPPKPILPM